MSIILHPTIAASTFVVPFRQRTLHSHRTCVGAASDVSRLRHFALSLSLCLHSPFGSPSVSVCPRLSRLFTAFVDPRPRNPRNKESFAGPCGHFCAKRRPASPTPCREVNVVWCRCISHASSQESCSRIDNPRSRSIGRNIWF